MKQAGLQARVKKKKQQKVVKESYNQASSKDEIMRYNNFWSGVEASTLLQNIEIKHSSSRTGSKLFQHFRVSVEERNITKKIEMHHLIFENFIFTTVGE